MKFDGKAFGQEIVKEVKSFVTKELAPLIKRLDDLDKRFDALPAPNDGKDADMNEVRSMITDELKSITEAVNAIKPAPELPDIPKMIDEAIAARMDVEDMERSIEGVVRSVLSEIPQPVSVKSALIDRDDHLILTLSNGDTKDLGVVVGKDGDPGKDGFGFDDLDFEYDGEKTAYLKFSRGEDVKEFTLNMPVVIDRGVFSEGKEYLPGDGVTWGGSFWIAQQKTTDKPDDKTSWRLAVKKGRDGRDGVMKEAPVKGPIRVTIPKKD